MRPNLNVAKWSWLCFAFAATSCTLVVVASLHGSSIDPVVVVFKRLCSCARVSIVCFMTDVNEIRLYLQLRVAVYSSKAKAWVCLRIVFVPLTSSG